MTSTTSVRHISTHSVKQRPLQPPRHLDDLKTVTDQRPLRQRSIDRNRSAKRGNREQDKRENHSTFRGASPASNGAYGMRYRHERQHAQYAGFAPNRRLKGAAGM